MPRARMRMTREMPRMTSQLDVKAAGFSGGAVGFLAGLSGFAYAGAFGSMMFAYVSFGVVSIMTWTIFGTAAGAIVAFVYNSIAGSR